MKHSVFHKMVLYQGYDGGKINVNISAGSGVDKNGFTMKGDIEMDGNEVKGLGAPTDDTSAVTKKWVDDEIVKQAAITIQPAGFTMTGDINMGGNEVVNLGDPTTGKSAVHRDWVVGKLNSPIINLDIAGDIDMKTHEIKNLGDPTTNKSAVSKGWFTPRLNT